MPEFNPSHMEVLFLEGLALIVAACVFAPLFRRIGLGTILGYLAAGLAVKTFLSLSLSEHPEELLHFAEFGVVLFLFVIGMELQPSRLWAMRSDILGLGLAQMLGCGAILSAGAYFAGLPVNAAIVVGMGLALSSTALVMRTLDERGERNSLHGRKAFAILLMQDLAIVPLLLMVSLMASGTSDWNLGGSLVHLALALAAIGLLILAARYALDPMFRLLAAAGMPEIMTAAALGVVIAAAMLMDYVGMSYAMGAFIAGVMLSESAYRHEVEANVEPFRGLFLGLFFMAVGLSLDLQVIIDSWLVIVIAAVVGMILKAAAIYLAARSARSDHQVSMRVGLSLAQFGEFGFVLFAAAGAVALLDPDTTALLIAIVTLSMALSPLVDKLERVIVPAPEPEQIEEDFTDAEGDVLLVGFGRFGQIVSQPLFAAGWNVTALDLNATRVREAATFGFRVHFGDGSRRDVLRAAGAADAKAIIVCVDEAQVTNHIVALVKGEFSQAKLLVRSNDRIHSIQLHQRNVDFVVRETFESALRLGTHALEALGTPEKKATEIIQDVRERDRERLRLQSSGDAYAGMDRLLGSTVKPEPLPLKDAKASDVSGGS